MEVNTPPDYARGARWIADDLRRECSADELFEDWRAQAQSDFFEKQLECIHCHGHTTFYCSNCEIALCKPCGYPVGDMSQNCVQCYCELLNAMERNVKDGRIGDRFERSQRLVFNKR